MIGWHKISVGSTFWLYSAATGVIKIAQIQTVEYLAAAGYF